MGSIMDQERPWERDPKGWDKPTGRGLFDGMNKDTIKCAHEWKSKFDFVYDYDHQICVKCQKTKMI